MPSIVVKDQVIQFSARDAAMILACSWHLDPSRDNGFYARTSFSIPGTRSSKKVRMHEMILGRPPKGFVVDHKDRNKLNNKRSNLRWITHSLNNFNRATQRNNTSGRRGVHFNKNVELYMAYASTEFLGYFKTRRDAYAAYLKGAARIFGNSELRNIRR